MVPVRARLSGLSVVHVGGGLRVSSRVAVYWRPRSSGGAGPYVAMYGRYHCVAGQWLSARTQVGEVLGRGELSVVAVIQQLGVEGQFWHVQVLMFGIFLLLEDN